jgi:hypothetical protein
VPCDYNNAKARVSKYEILSIHEELTEKRNALYLSKDSYNYLYEDDEEEDEDDEYNQDYYDNDEEK